MRLAKIFRNGTLAGMLTEDGGEYTFMYDSAYLASPSPVAISLTFPLQKEAYRSPVLFPFFDGLIPEGWLLDVCKMHSRSKTFVKALTGKTPTQWRAA